MRAQVLGALLSASSALAAFQIPLLDKIWPNMSLEQLLAQQGEQAPLTESSQKVNSTRIAIIGAGAGGSSAAFWIGKAKERYGLDVEVDLYEREGYVGGRECLFSGCDDRATVAELRVYVSLGSTTVYPYNDTSYKPVELGASIFVEINKNMWRASNEFNLTRYGFTNSEDDEEGELGFWDGEKFIITVSQSQYSGAKIPCASV